MADRCLADLHVHSKFSDRPSEWLLRRIGAPESFIEPRDIYQRCLRNGMDYVTITDHNSINGALEIAHLPKAFISAEVTTYFPEDGCKIHCLVCGITEMQFQEIESRRQSIYELRDYLQTHGIFHSIAHPLFRVNSKLTIEHVEKLLLLFNTFEGINGTRDVRAGELVFVIFRNLTQDFMGELAGRHNILPTGPQPWIKYFTGGSDDHSGTYHGQAYTTTPPAATTPAFLEHLRAHRHEMGGHSGSSLRMAHGIYRIAYDYYRSRFTATGRKGPGASLGALLERLAAGPEQTKGTWRDVMARFTAKVLGREQRRSAIETLLVQEFRQLMSLGSPAEEISVPPENPHAVDDQQAFRFACRVGHELGYVFARRFAAHLHKGELMESIESLAAMGPLVLSMAPYLATFAAQHKDESFLQAVATHFPDASHLTLRSEKKAWVTDTFTDINGVARTIQSLGRVAKARGRSLTIVTCLEKPPKTEVHLKNFRPVGTFKLPEYDGLTAVFPPFLEILQYFEKEKFSEVIISTPGPMGLVALAAGRLLGMRVTGIYHTDFPLYARYLTQDEIMEDLTWRYMQWFFGQLDHLFVPSECYRRQLAENGFDDQKLAILPRGVDVELFSPLRRQPQFWERFGIGNGLKFLYVGRVSAEKNIEEMISGFRILKTKHPEVSLVIVGDGPLLPELRKRCTNCGVYFTGYLEGEDLAIAYASADVFVFPSTTDTFGNAVLEAQACGLPAIVTDRGGPQEIVTRHNSGVIVELVSPEVLARAMTRLCEDDSLRHELSERALTNARDARWETILDEFWSPAQFATGQTSHEYDHIHNDPAGSANRSLQVA